MISGPPLLAPHRPRFVPGAETGRRVAGPPVPLDAGRQESGSSRQFLVT